MFGVLAALEANRIGLYWVPPFGATLSILFLVPDAAIAQPYPLIVGSVAGASVGTLISLFTRGLGAAVLAAVVAFGVMTIIGAYHRPGVALAIYPVLLHPGNWFPLLVVLPFTAIAVGSAALLWLRVACRAFWLLPRPNTSSSERIFHTPPSRCRGSLLP